MVSFILLIFAIIFAIIIAAVALTIIGQWKCFEKAGKPGWAALIPVYNNWVNCEVVGLNPWWSIVVLIAPFVPIVGSLLSLPLTIYFMVILYVSTARSFGKDDAYAVGLYFLGPIFWFLLGRSDVNYIGATPMNDVIMNFVDENILGKSNTASSTANNTETSSNDVTVNNSQTTQSKFCSSCGYKLESNDKFCPSCGRQL